MSFYVFVLQGLMYKPQMTVLEAPPAYEEHPESKTDPTEQMSEEDAIEKRAATHLTIDVDIVDSNRSPGQLRIIGIGATAI